MRHGKSERFKLEPVTGRLLPDWQVNMTLALWRAIAETDPVTPEDERLRDFCFYLLFALAGMARSRETFVAGSRAKLVPMKFDGTSAFNVCIVIRQDAADQVSLALSRPEQ